MPVWRCEQVLNSHQSYLLATCTGPYTAHLYNPALWSFICIVSDVASILRQRVQVELPQGLCVLGDAATCFNPIYGQGMTVGIKGAILLRDTLQKRLQGRHFTPKAASSVLSGFSKVSSPCSFLASCCLQQQAAGTDMLTHPSHHVCSWGWSA